MRIPSYISSKKQLPRKRWLKFSSIHIFEQDEFDAYEKALTNLPTEKMHKIFLEYVEKRLAAEKNDPIALMRRSELLAKMLEEGWTSDKDMEKVT